MLRLVHPGPVGQSTRLPKGRGHAPSLSLTNDERRHLAASLRNLRNAYGSWACLSEVMGGIREKTLQKIASGRSAGSAAVALAAARAGHTTVEAVLTGKLTDTSRCPSCGSTLRDRAALAAAGGAR